MTRPSHEHEFERLLAFQRDTQDAESTALFAEMLRHPEIAEPLAQFLIQQEHAPELSVLILLLGKSMSEEHITLLEPYLDSEIPELRRAAANAAGWARAAVLIGKLEYIETDDPDEAASHEARAAIDEILREYPGLISRVPHHKPLRSPSAEIPAEFDEVPVDHADESQAPKLMAALPRLLALRHSSVPLHLSPNDQLHLAVPMGSEKRLMATLSEITGKHVQLHPWPKERLKAAIETLYSLGDDDFCTFHNQLTPMARAEVTEEILSRVDPSAPLAPLDDANDAVEALQSFLAALPALKASRGIIEFRPPEMRVQCDCESGETVTLDPPAHGHRERFMDALRIIAGLEAGAGLGKQNGGSIRCAAEGAAPYQLSISSEKTMEADWLKFVMEQAS